jgi:site-specific recombinase XerD
MSLFEEAARTAITYLTKSEVKRFFAAIPVANHRDRLLFNLIYRYGLRRIEAAALRKQRITETGRIWIARAKGSRSGSYPIYPATRRLLHTHLEARGEDENPYLITSRQSGLGPISPSTIYTLFAHYAEQAGLAPELRHPHVLRHSIAIHLANVGWDVGDVQDWLGHRDISSTMVYFAITNKRRERSYRRATL